MGSAPTTDFNHRVVIEIAGPQSQAKFDQFRRQLESLARTYGAKIREEFKRKKKRAEKSRRRKASGRKAKGRGARGRRK